MDYRYQSIYSDRKSSSKSPARDVDDDSEKPWFYSTYSKLIAASVSILAVVMIINSVYTTSHSKISDVTSVAQSSSLSSASVKKALFGDYDVDISVALTSPGYSDLVSKDLLPWSLIAEPAREQVLTLESITVNDQALTVDEDSFNIEWTINDETYSGLTATFTLPATLVGTKVSFTVAVSAKTGKEFGSTGMDSSYYFKHSDEMIVKYIRRELRALTESDKTRFMTALHTMYTLSDEEGQATYGSKFHSAEYYLYKHLTGAGKTDCDHWHDGAGLLTHHAAFTLEVEQTLQAIDSAVSMPYWEYGMDPYMYDNAWDSIVFDKDLFGEMNPSNDDHVISDGSFWQGLEIPDGTKYAAGWDVSKEGSLNPYTNAYGAMRSAWNNNPTKYIGRHNMTFEASQYAEIPSCSLLKACYQSDSLADINYCLNGDTHGPVHILIGGAWGDEEVFADGDLGYIQNPDKVLFFKVLWRMGYTRCPESCTADETCACAIPDEIMSKYGAKKILLDTNIYDVIESQLRGASEATLEKVLRSVENPGVAGEMFTSAAPFDPTFWPLHGSIERIVGYKRVLLAAGTIPSSDFDETWGYPEYDKTDGAAYLNGVCDWSGVSSVSDYTQMPSCNMTASCSGHEENDILEFSNFLNKGETYTNADFYTFLHPWNEELPYVYDTYDFDYCIEEGYDFNDGVLVESQKAGGGGGGKKMKGSSKKGASKKTVALRGNAENKASAM